VIGQDGAWANDHRFHPISPNAYTGDSCTQTDGSGNAFNNVFASGTTASAVVPWGAGLQSDSCGGTNAGRREPPCPKADLRDLNYGLLGPQATSITYVAATGRLFTEPTNGRDGAYLIVRRVTNESCVLLPGGGRGCTSGGGRTSGAALPSGVITAVSYRDGHVCRLPAPTTSGVAQASCTPIGYTAPHADHVTVSQVVTSITVRKSPSRHYCTTGPLSVAPCKARSSLRSQHGLLLVEINFTARVSVSNANSHYGYSITYPSPGRRGCPGSGSGGMTVANIRAGQRVVFHDQIPTGCTGIVRGTVVYVPSTAAGGFGSASSRAPGHDGTLLVGQFSFVTP